MTTQTEMVDPASVDLGKGKFYLDADAKGARSGYITGSRRAIDRAVASLNDAGEGQIGIYRNCIGEGFFGYVIKYRGEVPYFEKVTGQ